MLLAKAKKIVGVGNLARDDLFFPLFIYHGKCNLHRFVWLVCLVK